MDKYLLGFDDIPSIGAVRAARTPLAPAKAPAPALKPSAPAGKTSASQSKAPRPAAKDKPRVTQSAKVPVRFAKDDAKKVSPHKSAMVSAVSAGKRAVDAGKQAAQLVAKYQADVKAGKHATLVPLTPTRVRGDSQIVLGAAKPLTPKQTAATARHASFIARHAAAVRDAEAMGRRAGVAGKAALDFSRKTTPFLKSKLTPKKGSNVFVRGMDFTDEELIAGLAELDDQEFEEVMEAIGLDASGLAPGQPGYDPSTDPAAQPGSGTPSSTPPAGGSGQRGLDPTTGIVTAPDGTVLYDPSQDPDVVPMPERGGKLSKEDAQLVWRGMPDDAIIYQGDRGTPHDSAGSWIVFYGDERTSDGSWGWGWLYGDPGQAERGRGGDRWVYRAPETAGNDHGGAEGFHDPPRQYVGSLSAIASNSVDRGWGPLIGNPKGQLAGLQFDMETSNWFWQGKNAPAWAAAEVDRKIQEANQKTIAANTAAAQAIVAQMVADAVARAEEQARQDAAQALAESQEASAAAIADSQARTEQTRLELEGQKLAQQQAQVDLEAQRAQAQIDAQAQHAMIDQVNIWNQWAAANPAAAMAEMQQQMSSDTSDPFADAGGGDASDPFGEDGGPLDPAAEGDVSSEETEGDEG